jgi:BlaI family transcriptional regulator, penicillinase repressor
MSKQRIELPGLTPAQGEIMDIVWELGEVSASEVRQVLSRTRAVARNTVRTLLERMEEKGWVTHCEDARTFLYSAAQPRQATIGQKVQEVVETVCGGSAEALVTALLDYRGLSSGELDRIRQMLAQARATKKEKGTP